MAPLGASGTLISIVGALPAKFVDWFSSPDGDVACRCCFNLAGHPAAAAVPSPPLAANLCRTEMGRVGCRRWQWGAERAVATGWGGSGGEGGDERARGGGGGGGGDGGHWCVYMYMCR